MDPNIIHELTIVCCSLLESLTSADIPAEFVGNSKPLGYPGICSSSLMSSLPVCPSSSVPHLHSILSGALPYFLFVTFGLHWTSFYHADTSDCFVSFPLLPLLKPMYDTIWLCSRVRYDLALLLCTIRSGDVLVYDINLRATHTTILSLRGVTIPIYLVSSATDSIR